MKEAFLLGLIAVGLLTGCAGTLDRSISSCFAHGSKPAYTQAADLTRFECR